MFAFPLLCILNVRVHGLHPMLFVEVCNWSELAWNIFLELGGKLIDCLTAFGRVMSLGNSLLIS